MSKTRTAAAVATPRSWRKPKLVLGPITVVCGLKSLNADEKLYAKTLCPCHLLPVKQVNTCQLEGAVIEAIKRYEVGDTWVELDPAELKTPSDYTINLEVAPAELDLAYVGKPYLLWPEEGYGDKYDMLAAALEQTGRMLIGTACLNGSATQVFGVRWSSEFGVLFVHQLEYAENIATGDISLVLEASAVRPAPPKEYVDLIATLIEALDDEYDADSYTNDYRNRMCEALAAAKNGQPIPTFEAPTQASEPVDLMAALKASVAERQKPAAKSAVKKPAAKPAARKPAARKKVTR